MRKKFGWSVLSYWFYSHIQKEDPTQDSTVGTKCNYTFFLTAKVSAVPNNRNDIIRQNLKFQQHVTSEECLY